MKPKLDLSERQEEILQLMTEGLTGKEVGARLGISPKTVDVHTQRAVDRLNARNRWHAVLLWDRLRREQLEQAARAEQERQQQQARSGFVHCPTCGGAGFVRRAA